MGTGPHGAHRGEAVACPAPPPVERARAGLRPADRGIEDAPGPGEPRRYTANMSRVLALVPLLLSISLPALAAEPQDYAGRWTFDESSGDRAGVDAAVEATCAEFPKLFRGLVRKKLAPAAEIAEFFVFEPGDNQLTITTNRSDGWTTDLSATPVEKRSVDGHDITLRRWMKDGVLHTQGDTGAAITAYVFTIQPDGRLRIDVTVSGDRLPKPLAFSLHYLRG